MDDTGTGRTGSVLLRKTYSSGVGATGTPGVNIEGTADGLDFSNPLTTPVN
jgi:hypothetical protein